MAGLSAPFIWSSCGCGLHVFVNRDRLVTGRSGNSRMRWENTPIGGAISLPYQETSLSLSSRVLRSPGFRRPGRGLENGMAPCLSGLHFVAGRFQTVVYGRLLCQQRKGTREVTLNGLSAGRVGQRAATAGGRQGWPVNPPTGLPGETWVTLLNLNSRKAVNDLLCCVRSTYTKHYLD